ncbi:NnrS family protein [Massilia sp. TWR1-2-2]|uniref:NnrS family protein n=1 Tax=Massilia sp. TWR1-2-2 TaxID=2804584 RepID=UPI003CEE8B20
MSLTTIDESVPAAGKVAASPFAHPIWALGFRPFYLLAAVFAAVAVPVWVAQYFGYISWQRVGLAWHMHEMVFGMAVAVIAGFLLTAVRAWTGLWTARGGQLAALAALWLAGRVALLAAPPLLGALIDIAFLPLTAWLLFRVLRRAGNKRNQFLPLLLVLLTIANALYHAAMLGWIALSPATPVQAAILIIVLIESVIGARVIPMFTRNGVPGSAPLVNPKRDKIALGLTVAAIVVWLLPLPPAAFAGFAVAAGCASLLRLAGWQPQRTLAVPLVWILHLSYAWIPVGFFLLALAELQLVTPSAAFHALAVGSMAGLIIGMMTRTTLGHTGRALVAGAAETSMFWLIQLGAVARLFAALGPAEARELSLIGAALAWSLAFSLFVMVYGRFLWQARIDGKEG